MPDVKPIVSDVTIGNAYVAIDCVWLGCLANFEFRLTMEEVPIVCDWAEGRVTTLRGNPTGEITIEAKNLNAVLLGYALDADVSEKDAAETVDCEEHILTWVPNNEATPTQWVASLCLRSPSVSEVVAYTDNACTVPWEGDATPEDDLVITDACTGCLTLTANAIPEPPGTLYFAYTHNTETPIGATLIKPPFNTFATDHQVVAVHRHATTGELVVYKFWRTQIIPDMTIRHDDTNRVITVPIRMAVLSTRAEHPDAPLMQAAIHPFGESYSYSPYTDAPAAA